MGRFNLSEIDIIRHSSNKLWKTFKDWKVIFLYSITILKELSGNELL